MILDSIFHIRNPVRPLNRWIVISTIAKQNISKINIKKIEKNYLLEERRIAARHLSSPSEFPRQQQRIIKHASARNWVAVPL